MWTLQRQTVGLLLFTVVFAVALVFSLLFQSKEPLKGQADPATAASVVSNQQRIAEQLQALPAVGTFVYGKSGLGANLNCIRILPDKPVKTSVLMTLEIHGYEDAYAKDGQVLVDIGNAVIAWASSNRSVLDTTALYVVPSANPDGLADGISQNGKGRCQMSLGVNINRDFPTGFKVIANARDHTLAAPLAAPESQALVDLVTQIKPAVVVDVHGWEDHVLGNAAIASFFLPVTVSKRFSAFDAKCNGFFSLWASTQGAESILLELPRTTKGVYPVDFYSSRIESSISALVQSLGE